MVPCCGERVSRVLTFIKRDPHRQADRRPSSPTPNPALARPCGSSRDRRGRAGPQRRHSSEGQALRPLASVFLAVFLVCHWHSPSAPFHVGTVQTSVRTSTRILRIWTFWNAHAALFNSMFRASSLRFPGRTQVV